MPLFMSGDEFARYSNDAAAVALAEKADNHIKKLMAEVETVKALLDASSITAEQTCSILEHKHLSLSSDFSDLQSQCSQLRSSLAEVEAREHSLRLQLSRKDGEAERLAVEVSELHQSKRQLMELVEQKELLLSENTASIRNYLDKIVSLMDTSSQKEARIREIEAELSRCKAACSRLAEEKEIVQQHNLWLNEELKGKHESLIETRKLQADLEGDLSSKIIDLEKQLNESTTSLNWHKERVRELERMLSSSQKELCSWKDSAAANEERLLAEISTINKLVELYKESSEEWSRKAADLEGVVKALEMHLRQVENDYNDKLDKEQSTRRFVEKEAEDLKLKLEKLEMEVESVRKKNELEILPVSYFNTERGMVSSDVTDIADGNQTIISKVPVGVSGTALAASLLRDGWSLAKMYSKYQEAVDALRHEQMGRKEAESVLQRVLSELEGKAEIILDERAEHERMAEAYYAINQKLQNANSEQLNLEKVVKELKADLKRHERDYILAQEEIVDLEKQVTVLLKECRDIQLRCGSNLHSFGDEDTTVMPLEACMDSNLQREIPEQLLTYKDINALVEQNVHLRSLVRSLSTQMENKELEIKENFEMELNKQTGEAASKVAAVLQRVEEQAHMIESLHNSVAMYKKLYEEHKLHSSSPNFTSAIQGDHGTEFRSIIESSQEAAKKAQEQAAERVKYLEEELAKSRSKLILVQSERDKFALEADFAKEKLEGLLKETEHKKEEINGVLARNVEFSQLIVDYQRKLRESSDSLQSADESVRKLTMEISILKQEKEILSKAEKRASDEVWVLTDRVSRLQATLDAMQSAKEVHESVRSADRQKQEEYLQHIQREWAEAKKELHAEKDRMRMLTTDRDQSMKDAMRKVDELGKELANALRAAAAAETRAAVAEALHSHAAKGMKSEDSKGLDVHPGDTILSRSSNQVAVELGLAKEEMEKLKEEAKVYKEHMLQYKSIADVNETALKQMEITHDSLRTEADNIKKSLEAEVSRLGERISQLESEVALKSEQVTKVIAENEESLASVSEEIMKLRDDRASKIIEITALGTKVSSLEEKWKNEHERWRSAQANYERQVVLQSDTIQELTRTSEALSLLQQEAIELRRLADKQRTENDELKAKWEAEKSTLMESKSDVDKKCQQLDEQNKILLDQLEALHIKMAENDRNAVGTFGAMGIDRLGDGNIQTVISYLRRSKEIAETEISLLKQEKLRLQSQLEGSLKAAESAEALLRAERASAKSILYTEAEFKALQLQIRELSLLRESNMQLREENKHNFMECQRLRDEAQNTIIERERISNQLEEHRMEIESLKNECQSLRMEKDKQEKRISELLKRCETIDVDCERFKDEAQQMQLRLIEKETRIEEINGLASERLLRLSQLEQNLESCRSQLSEKEKRVHDLLLTEEKQKKIIAQFKRKVDSLAKEKEELARENQTLSKQLEELKQGRVVPGDTNLEVIMKEKEEKDTRIQTMEKTIERHREVLKKEKERRQKIEESVMDSQRRADEEKAKVSSELEKHKQALKQLAGDLEKLKHMENILPEGTSAVQLLSGNVLDDLVTSCVLAIESFERVAKSIAGDLGGQTNLPDTDISTAVASAPGQATTVVETSNPVPKFLEERGRPTMPKSVFETRKAGRKLVRPRLKADQTQEVEMSEGEGSLNVGKPALSKETESNLSLVVQNPLRKRLASASDALDQSQNLGEGPSDVSVHLPKKFKGSDVPLDSSEGHSRSPAEDLCVLKAAEESVATESDFPQESGKATLVSQSDDTQVMVENPEEDATPDESAEALKTIDDDTLDKPSGSETVVNDLSKDLMEQVPNPSGVEFSTDKEEGELISETGEDESEGDLPHVVENPGIGEGKPEQLSMVVDSPLGGDDMDTEATSTDLGDVSATDFPPEDKVEDGEITEGTNESSEKIADGDGLGIVEEELEAPKSVGETAGSAPAEIVASRRSVSPRPPSEAEESRRPSPVSSTSTTINLLERAKQRAAIRQAGAQPTQSVRGAGRIARGRVVRGGRGGRVGRGQAPGDQGQPSSKG